MARHFASKIGVIALSVVPAACMDLNFGGSCEAGATCVPVDSSAETSAIVDTATPFDSSDVTDITTGDSDALPDVVEDTCAADCDGDGYPAPADCNDHDASINPEAYDFIGDGIDDDCSGKADDPVESCPPTDTLSKDAVDYAHAIDICRQKSRTKAGAIFDSLQVAEWGAIHDPGDAGTGMVSHPNGVALLPSFGTKVVKGTNMAWMSTGPNGDPNPHKSPALGTDRVADICKAIPLSDPDCGSLIGSSALPSLEGRDYNELRLTLRVPSNVHGAALDFSLFTAEFNQFWNTGYNDVFLAIVTTKDIDAQNVARDPFGLAISVNSGFMQVCPKLASAPSVQNPVALKNCVGVDGDPAANVIGSLAGITYDGHLAGAKDDLFTFTGSQVFVFGASTGWLESSFAVEPGETITVRLIIFDMMDETVDTGVVIDNFHWKKTAPSPASGATARLTP